METEIIDKLFLELSQFTGANTKKEHDLVLETFKLKREIKRLKTKIREMKKRGFLRD